MIGSGNTPYLKAPTGVFKMKWISNFEKENYSTGQYITPKNSISSRKLINFLTGLYNLTIANISKLKWRKFEAAYRDYKIMTSYRRNDQR